MKRRASFHNLGCKVNAYETEAMEQLLESGGYEIVPFGEEAEVCIINTCSVTNIADRKSRQMLHRARAKNPGAVIVAAGCYVQAAADVLKEDAAVDILIGNNRKKDLLKILEDYFQDREKEDSFVLDISRTKEYENLHIGKISDHTRAFVKVQDGCNQFCSYCIIPYTRGRVRSRRKEDVLDEGRRLAARGYKELVLTGIHLSSYGTDRREEEMRGEEGGKIKKREMEMQETKAEQDFLSAGRGSLLELIQLLHGIEGIERIRLGSLEPRIITRDFARALANLPKVCPHFHLSLQSGAPETLKRMNRHYTPDQYRESCGYLREAFDHPAITTDVIVGFPGETEEEFAKTREFVRQVQFYEMHVFKYSRRKNTRAASMPDQVDEAVKAERSEALLKLEAEMSKAYRESFIGKKVQVLLEEEAIIGGNSYAVGFTREYVKMAVPLADVRRVIENEGNADVCRVIESEGNADVCRAIEEENADAHQLIKEKEGKNGFQGRLVFGQVKRALTAELMEFTLIS